MMHPSRQAYVEDPAPTEQEASIDLADIPIDRDHYIPPNAAGIAPEKASAILSQFQRRRRAAAIAVPTDDGRVRAQLRAMGEPITLFGEGLGDRRDRLRELMTLQIEAQDAEAEDVDVEMKDDGGVTPDGVEDGAGAGDDQDEEFYTNGSDTLLEVRRHIAQYSLPRAKRRIQHQKIESTIPLRTHVKHRKAIKAHLSEIELFGTQIAGDRPVSLVRFSPNGEMVAAGNWSGGIKLLGVPNLDEIRTLRGHTDRVGGICWYPGATLSSSDVSSSAVNLASGGGEGSIHLWNLEQDIPISSLLGHSGRVCRTEFHPSGKYLASASFDTTWRLWDVPSAREILLQEGHSREVYALKFSPDGNLLASAGLDSIGRIWDLRTGRTVMILDKHIKDIYALDWSPDSYRILSGSGDGFARCWDLRAVREAGAIGANKGGVTDLKWYKGLDQFDPPTLSSFGDDSADTNGNMKATIDEQTASSTMNGADRAPMPKKSGTFFVSAGFDKNVQIFSTDDWALVRTLSGHSGNVLGVDVTDDARYIASCGHDRTVKLWARDDGACL